MMNKADREKLKASLNKAIGDWWDDHVGDLKESFWTSDNLTVIMADAAMSVMEASVDIQEFLKEQGELKG